MNDQVTLTDDARFALGLALKILDELPENIRPISSMADMRSLLDGQSSGRDGLIVAQAVALALAHLTQQTIADTPILTYSPDDSEPWLRLCNERLNEFAMLFGAIRHFRAVLLPAAYLDACRQLGWRQ